MNVDRGLADLDGANGEDNGVSNRPCADSDHLECNVDCGMKQKEYMRRVMSSAPVSAKTTWGTAAEVSEENEQARERVRQGSFSL